MKKGKSNSKMDRRQFLKVASLGTGMLALGPFAKPRSVSAKEDLPKQIKIGLLLPLTGAASIGGIDVKQGAQLAAKIINSKGGIKGSEIVFVDGDTQCTPTPGATSATKLSVRDKVNFIIGDYCSSSALAAIPIIAKANIPIFVIALAQDITGKSHTPNVFRISCGAHLDMPPVGKFAAKEKGHKSFAAIIVNNDWGRSMAQWFDFGLNKYGGAIKETIFYDMGTIDFSPPLDRVRGMKNIDALYVCGYVEDSINITETYRKYNMEIPFYGNDLVADYAFQQKVGKKAVGFHFPWLFDPNSKEPWVQEYVEAYKKEHGKVPGRDPGWGWSAVHIIKETVDSVGTVDPAKCIDYIYKKDKFKLTCGEYGFASPCGQSKLVPGVATYNKDGEIVLVTSRAYGSDAIPPFCID